MDLTDFEGERRTHWNEAVTGSKPSHSESIVLRIPELSYLTAQPIGLMTEQLREFYKFYERNKVPIEWHEAF
jgi:hypothetical protein